MPENLRFTQIKGQEVNLQFSEQSMSALESTLYVGINPVSRSTVRVDFCENQRVDLQIHIA